MNPGITGFFDESPGVRSMSRLVMLLLAACVVLLVLTLCVIALHGAFTKQETAATIAALAAPLGTVLAGNWGIARERHAAPDAPTPPEPPQ